MSSSRPNRTRDHAFTLIEVTLALGIVAFALVGILGVMPLALSSERQGVDEGRAAAVATTLFATFRQQPFQNVLYVDSQFDSSGNPQTNPNPAALDLATVTLRGTTTPPYTQGTVVTLYAKFLGVASDVAPNNPDGSSDIVGNQRRLCFTSAAPAVGADYQVALSFSQPACVFPVSQPGVTPATNNGLAVQMEIVVTPIGRPQRQFHFESTIVNCWY
jgi:uncharacterized protein (TIGR02598 family)